LFSNENDDEENAPQPARTAEWTARNQNATSSGSREQQARVKQFVAERDSALLSLDEATIRAHMAKWNIRTPADPEMFWTGIHEARTACVNLPRDARLS
jgi:hypothetical protein